MCVVDKNGSKNLGKFIFFFIKENGNIYFFYLDGDDCGCGKKIRINIIFVCKLGDLESVLVLRIFGVGGCFYEFEWYIVVVCVLLKIEGENCMVFDF